MVGEGSALGPEPRQRPERAQRADSIETTRCLPSMVELPQVRCRSGCDAEGGGRARMLACERMFAAAAALLERAGNGWSPYFLTLTVNRKPWVERYGGNEREAAYQAFRALSRKVPHVMRRLRMPEWVQKREWQSATGCGWVHFHLLVLVPDSLKRDHVERLVKARWSAMLGAGWIKAQKGYRKGGTWDCIPKYLAPYMAKGGKEFPPVLDDPRVLQAPKLMSASKAVRARVRSRVQVLPRLPRAKRQGQKRNLRPLAERLAWSPLTVRERRWAERVVPQGEPKARYKAQHGRVRLMPSRAVEELHSAGLLTARLSFSAVVYGHAPRMVLATDRPVAVARWLEDHAEEVAQWAAEEARERRAHLCDAWHLEQIQRAELKASRPKVPRRGVPPWVRKRLEAAGVQ